MASLPHDIIVDVLCRLSVKDLVRFRCISKPFCCSIDDQDFVKLHLSHSLETNHRQFLIHCYIDYCNRSFIFRSVNFDSLKEFQNLNHPFDELKFTRRSQMMLASCNGLLAFSIGDEEILLWNPSTRRSQILPATESECPLGASPTIRWCFLGLGYDPISDDYKLVQIIQLKSFFSEVNVYSLRSNSWRRIKDFPFYLRHCSLAFLANNSLHWVVSKLYDSITSSVAAFDLETEEYHLLELPNCLANCSQMNVAAMGGYLCLIAKNYWGEGQAGYEIWMMKEYGVKESWTKLTSVNTFVRPLAFSKSDARLLLDIHDKGLVWYDMTSKRVDKITIEGAPSSSWGPRRGQLEMVVESLVPLNGNGAMMNKEKKKKLKRREKEVNFELHTLYNYISDYKFRSIIIAVLCRLSVKDLLRLACVSKPFCSLIHDPNFIMLHLSHSLKTNTNLSLILKHNYLFSLNFYSLTTLQKLNHPYFYDSNEEKNIEIVGSCHGWLALSNPRKREISLFNPSIRKSFLLPDTEIVIPPWASSYHFIVYGLGYDPISDDYKLVRVVQFYGDCDDGDSFYSEVKVFSMRTDAWRKIKDFPFWIYHVEAHGVLANDALHWLASTDLLGVLFIAAFDLEIEEYHVVEMPNHFVDKSCVMTLRAMGGCLCLIADYYKENVVDIWMMKEYGVKESWHKISLEQSGLPLGYSENGDKVLLNIDKGKLVWYDLISKSVEEVRIKGAPSSFKAELLVESLVPLSLNANN